jgi:hypothetical protein
MVEALVHRMAIYDVVARYCRGIDRMDAELVRSCYHPDATDEHGSFHGTVDEYLAWVFRLLGTYDSTQHLIANHLVDFAGNTPASGVAVSETYGVSVHQTAGGSLAKNLVVGFRFVDRFEYRDGRWLIAARAATTEWTRALDPAKAWPTPDHLRRGERGPSDVLVAFLAALD